MLRLRGIDGDAQRALRLAHPPRDRPLGVGQELLAAPDAEEQRGRARAEELGEQRLGDLQGEVAAVLGPGGVDELQTACRPAPGLDGEA
jgi:hypothetical protein